MEEFFQKNKLLLLGIIIITAVFLRFWQLGQIPISLDPDEAAWGYNAYAIGQSGKDEFGVTLPYKYLESFGDFKPPVYAYFTVLPVKIFGLNEFATRFASAFFGSLTVLITYFLVLRLFLFSQKKYLYAFFSAFFLAISPWHINLSRAAFEANVSSFFIVCGVWLFLGFTQNKKWYLPFSVISLALSFYTFNTARVFVPILGLCLLVFFYKKLLLNKKIVVLSAVIGLTILLPLVPFLLSPQAKLRYEEVNIFSDSKTIEVLNQEAVNDNNAFWSKIIHNRRFDYSVLYLKHYLDNFNPQFLFVSGDQNQRFSTQDMGQLYLFDLPFLLLGTFLLFYYREKQWWIIPVWLLLAIIPAATARETPHALRTETTLPMYQILVAYGFVQALMWIKGYKKALKPFVGISFIFLLICFIYYLHSYYIHYPSESAGQWNNGYKQSISYVKAVEQNYQKIVVTKSMSDPYIYYLFYLKTNPQEFRQTSRVTRDVFGFVNVESFDKFVFTNDFSSQKNKNKILFIGSANQVLPNSHVVKKFYNPDGYISLVAFTQ